MICVTQLPTLQHCSHDAPISGKRSRARLEMLVGSSMDSSSVAYGYQGSFGGDRILPTIIVIQCEPTTVYPFPRVQPRNGDWIGDILRAVLLQS